MEKVRTIRDFILKKEMKPMSCPICGATEELYPIGKESFMMDYICINCADDELLVEE